MRIFIIPIFCICCLSMLSNQHVNAQERIYSGIIPNASATPALVFAELADPLSIKDPIYYDPALRALIGDVKKMQNVVMLKINEESGNFIPSDFNVTVQVKIITTALSGTVNDPVYKDLQLSYRLGMAQKSDAASYFVSEPQDGGYVMSVQIIDITKNVSWDVIPFLQIIGEIRSLYDAPFLHSSNVTGLANLTPGSSPFDELTLEWNYPGSGSTTFNSFPTDFDVEWAWVDFPAADNYKTSSNWDLSKIFYHNTTRVTVPISQTSYRVPVIYDNSGWLFYRVRAVQQKIDGQIIHGNWASGITANAGMFELTSGHEDGLNWQVSTTYAEDGKRKTVIQYFDGSLRGRQTVTKDNSQATPTTVVAETFYDFQGRPTIQVLPAPTLSNIISFTKNFNAAVSQDGYPKEMYDLLQSGQAVCGNPAPALQQTVATSNINGAGNYYSSQNPDVNSGFNKFIPNANGFPFTETRYTQDATGRISAQSGVGQAFRLGSNHETKYFYKDVTQDEIDLLFGTDAGKASHYQKTMVRDANGQYSVSYTDMYGRTVATALAGSSPASLDPLKSLTDLNTAAYTGVKKQLLDEETNVVDGRNITMVKELVVTTAGPHYFEYKLDPKQLLLQNCAAQNICYDCLYDLTITITNNCTSVGVSNVVHTVSQKNFTLPHTTVCSTETADIEIAFNLTLDEGSYTITKTLTLSEEAQNLLRASALQNNVLVCKTEQEIRNEISAVMLLQNTNCQPTCGSCEASLGGERDFRDRFMTGAGLQEGDMGPYEAAVLAAYNEAKAACDAICENGSDRLNDYRRNMLGDMMPDAGQYARIFGTDVNGKEVRITDRKFNIFGTGAYKLPKAENGEKSFYRDPYGIVDVIAKANLDSWPDETFNANFKQSWANELLFHHPEFQKLKIAETELKETYRWGEQLQQKTAWTAVSTTVSGLPGSDPFYTTVLSGSALQTAMNAKIQLWRSVQIGSSSYTNVSMWQFALASVKCKEALLADQATCLQSCSTYAIGSFPSEISCAADKEMVWHIFSNLYFHEREIFIYKYLKAKAPVDETIFAKPTNAAFQQYEARFIDPEAGVQTYLPAELQDLYNATGSGNGTAAQTELEIQYESNCLAYVEQWLSQLKVFDVCKNSNLNYTTLIAQLVNICKAGSDFNHPLGSSSINPAGDVIEPASFEQAISLFMSANSISISETCHPFVINWPKPFNNSPSLGVDVVYETEPDDCICTRFNELNTLYSAAIAYPNPYISFSQFMKTRFGTVISQEDLETMMGLCDTEPDNCKYLETPIKLPPAMQCGAKNEICISCEQYTTYRNAFLSQFSSAIPSGLTIPVTSPANDTELKWNKAFADYMNYKTGFGKEGHDYAAFAKTCEFINQPVGIQSRIFNIVDSFYIAYNGVNTDTANCEQLFTNYFNAREGVDLNFAQINGIYYDTTGTHLFINCCDTCNVPESAPARPIEPLTNYLCGLNLPISSETQLAVDDPCDDINQLIDNSSIDAYKFYLLKVKNDFDKAYMEKCLAVQAIESFTVRAPNEREYHYTLYYYDQSGSLVQTVPPAGVDNFGYNETTRTTFLTNVKTHRAAQTSHKPSHTLVTKYRYNTLGQVVQQQSPDAGLSKFWYDELGRLVVSQNAKQANTNRYSYTLYDELGRITQVGQKPTSTAVTQFITRDKDELLNWLNNTGTAKEQITRTVYDVSYYNGANDLGTLLVQQNLRNRVSYTQVITQEPSDHLSNASAWSGIHSAATYFTYDIHGNVNELVQDLKKGVVEVTGQRYKKIACTYDLISGKVNTVNYQPDFWDVNGDLQQHADRFHHRYDYDAENKLVTAHTSQDGIIWETDARYKYYKHGPLARTELGHQRVQGIDYAYTLQGWLKGVNSTAISAAPTESCAEGTAVEDLEVYNRQQYGQPPKYIARRQVIFFPEFTSNTPDDFETEINPALAPCIPLIAPTEYVNGDMGQDGKTGSLNDVVARDAYSFSLNYFSGDYEAIKTAEQPFSGGMFDLTNTTSGTVATQLFNGNIASMFVNIPKLGEAQLYGYKYDQLNRIVSMDAFGGFVPSTNGWETSGPVASANYKERISYDPNGNILTYLRNGSTLPPVGGGPGGQQTMDQLTYGYNVDGSSKLVNNRLRHVKDAIADGNYTEDIDNQADDNYGYDEIGNLITDVKEGISNIVWNVYGKISSITKTGGTTIAYTYDASGNRISKTVAGTSSSADGITYYVRDASGNVMSIYEEKSTLNSGDITQTEAHLYGSSRLGIFSLSRNVENVPANAARIYTFERGNKVFELSNHLGNVLVTISDRKLQVQDEADEALIGYYAADVISAADYYPFGMQMPGREFGVDSRYGFNGKERDKDLHSLTAYDYGFRIYNPAIGKFLSVDPLTGSYPELTPYQFAGNGPVTFIDLDGLEMAWRNPATGEIKAAGPLALPIGSKNSDGWILFQPSVRTPKPSAATSEVPIYQSTLQQGSDNLASLKAEQTQQIALKSISAKPKVAHSVTTVSADNRPEWQRKESAMSAEQTVAFQKLQARVSTDPIAMNGYLSAGAMVSTVRAPVIAVENGINNAKEGDWWGVAGNSLEFGLSIAPFIPFKGGAAAAQLAKIEAASGGHFLVRHGAQTSLSSQYLRSVSGLTPDGIVLGEVNASRFFSHEFQLEAVTMAKSQFAATGKTSFTLDMNKLVGEGYLKGGGAGSYRTTTQVQAVFKDGQLTTLYPLIR